MKTFEKLEKEILKETKEYVKNDVKKRFIKLAEVSVIIFLGFISLTIGLAELLGNFFKVLDNGFNYIIIGFLYILIGFLLEK